MTRYQWFRRVAAPIAVVLAMMLLVRTSCQEKAKEPVHFQLDLGARSADVRHVRVDLWDGDTSAGWFERDFGDAGADRTVSWDQPVPDPDLDATVEVTVASGEITPVRVKVHAEPGGSTVIPVR